MQTDSFHTKGTLEVDGAKYQLFRLSALAKSHPAAARLPFSLKVLLENLLRHEDGRVVRREHVEKMVAWDAKAAPDTEISFHVARVLLQDARLIVLDEPFNAIDARTSVDLLALVRRWHAEKRTVLAALHDMDLVRAHFPETLLLARGPVAWGATSQVLTAENLLEARRMCEAFDDSAAACAVDDTASRAA